MEKNWTSMIVVFVYLFFWRDDDVLLLLSNDVLCVEAYANEMLWKFFFSWLKCVDRGVDDVEKKSKIWLMTGFSDSISS